MDLLPKDPSSWWALGSSSFGFCSSQRHRQSSRHMVNKSLREFLKKQSIQWYSGRELQQSIPDWVFWQLWGCSSSVWLNEANSMGFWYETFQWHNWHSVRVIVESDLHFPRWRGEVPWKCLQIQSKFSLKEDLDLLKSLDKSLDVGTWERFFSNSFFSF